MSHQFREAEKKVSLFQMTEDAVRTGQDIISLSFTWSRLNKIV